MTLCELAGVGTGCPLSFELWRGEDVCRGALEETNLTRSLEKKFKEDN